MEKERFEFYIDEQVTTWYRNRFSIEATSVEEATALVTEAFKQGGSEGIPMLNEYCDDSESEILYDATETTGKEQLYSWDSGNLLAEHG
jgi:hypothetical protein